MGGRRLGTEELWDFVRRVKLEPRRGWIGTSRVGRIESVADHTLGVAVLSLIEAQKRGYDVESAVVLALIHDLEEAITGDLTPSEKRRIGAREVVRRRRRARSQILRSLPVDMRGGFRRLWLDLDGRRTREARLVRDLDKLEMALQAKAYEKLGGVHRQLAKFYASAEDSIVDSSIRKRVRALG